LQRDNNLAGKIQREWILYHYYLFRNLQNLKRKQIMIVYNFQQELCTIVFHLQGQIETCRKFIFPYYIIIVGMSLYLQIFKYDSLIYKASITISKYDCHSRIFG
jgi:hypothetical protein